MTLYDAQIRAGIDAVRGVKPEPQAVIEIGAEYLAVPESKVAGVLAMNPGAVIVEWWRVDGMESA